MKTRLRLDLRAGLAAAAICAACPAHAQVTETVLYNFTGGNDGFGPGRPLLADTAGRSGALLGLYGTDWGAGDTNGNCLVFGCGAAFKLTLPRNGRTAWTEKTLWDFTGNGDGGDPTGLISRRPRIGHGTVLYGTTFFGNNFNGTVFSLTGHQVTTIWSFTGGSDGANPFGQPVIDATGNVYASAQDGGSSYNGTVIMLTPPGNGNTAWTETTIWNFSGGNDGAYPEPIIADKDGALYGTTQGGGSTGNGVVFKLIPPAQGQTAWTEQTLWSFAGGNDGSLSLAPLTLGRHGEVYGTTYFGGLYGNGTVFRLLPPKAGHTDWTEQILWNFTGGSDGATTGSAVILDRTGAVFGTTSLGASSFGTAFKLTPPGQSNAAWSETTLWTFSGGSDGGEPVGPLTADNTGVLYGTAFEGGANDAPACDQYGNIGCGVVFSLTGTGYVP